MRLTAELGVRIVFAADGTDDVLGFDDFAGLLPGGLVRVLPSVRGSRSQILRAAIGQRQSRSSVA